METIAQNFQAFAVRKLQMGQRDIARCVELLSPEQMLFRHGPYENSVTNLLLHLEGNLQQWVLHGIDNQANTRQRDEEFSLDPAMGGTAAKQKLDATVQEVCRIILRLTPEQLLKRIDPLQQDPWRDVTMLEAVFQIVSHFQLHTGQILMLTKQILGRDLDFSIPRKR